MNGTHHMDERTKAKLQRDLEGRANGGMIALEKTQHLAERTSLPLLVALCAASHLAPRIEDLDTYGESVARRMVTESLGQLQEHIRAAKSGVYWMCGGSDIAANPIEALAVRLTAGIDAITSGGLTPEQRRQDMMIDAVSRGISG
jgi:hypothetical protein